MDHGTGQASAVSFLSADLPDDEPATGAECICDVAEPFGPLLDVHLYVHGRGCVERSLPAERGHVGELEAHHVSGARLRRQVSCSVDVFGGDVDAEHLRAGSPGDLAGRTAQAAADVEDCVAGRDVEARDEPLEGGRSAGVVLVKIVQGAGDRDVEVGVFAEQVVDGRGDVVFGVGHRSRSVRSCPGSRVSCGVGDSCCGGWAGRMFAASTAPAAATAAATKQATVMPWSKAATAVLRTASAKALCPLWRTWSLTPKAAPMDWCVTLASACGRL